MSTLSVCETDPTLMCREVRAEMVQRWTLQWRVTSQIMKPELVRLFQNKAKSLQTNNVGRLSV